MSSFQINSPVPVVEFSSPLNTALTVVPSTLMKTPSEAFSRSNKSLYAVGITHLTVAKFNDASIRITELEGFLDSGIGSHFVQLHNNEHITLAPSLTNGTIKLWVEIQFNQNDFVAGNFPLDDLIFTFANASPSSKSLELATIEVVSGAISTTTISADIKLTQADMLTLLHARLGVGSLDADTLSGHSSSEFATKKEVGQALSNSVAMAIVFS